MKTTSKIAVQFSTALLTIWLFGELRLSAGVVSYAYDTLNRLTSVNYGNGAVISYTYDAAGNRLTYSGGVTNDAVVPTIAITSPTSGPAFTTINATISLSGTASDNTGISLITWVNYVTWEDYAVAIGTASGTAYWNISGIHLQSGENYIYVTAYDLAGNSTDAALTVTYMPPVGPALQTSFSNGSLNLAWPAASASDYVLQYADSLSPPILWSNVIATVRTNSGTLTVTLPTTNAQRFFRLQK